MGYLGWTVTVVPVALTAKKMTASSLLGTRPLFIFGASLVGSRVAPNLPGEQFDRGEFVLKFTAVVLIAVGQTSLD